ncbi:hypothetical protein SLS56_010203 [Neofusicoccum ribis]|uniref:Elongator complex protein 5 n=1 Tax=Neofusicoccum ribis TaxID=45134 RepID=A0ABR3SF38_9PEZI
MSSSKQLQHRRAHNLLLISKLLNCRDNASPFTLIIDSLEQSGKRLVREFIRRANTAKTRVIFVSFETLRKPAGVDVFIPFARQSPTLLQSEIAKATSEAASRQKTLLVLDTLHPLITHPTTSATLPHLLSSLLSPSTTLLAVYHSDIPLGPPLASPYQPHPLTLLKYISTTLLTVHALPHILAEKAARERSVAGPVFGLGEEVEGAVGGVGRNGGGGVVVEMEHRRKSGRGVREWFFLPTATGGGGAGAGKRETAVLLEDHPAWRRGEKEVVAEEEGVDVSFNLGLTEKQRRDREGVVLPYFDAQKGEGPGEGGRILYDMGVEDDFDEEEDEI